ncbi:MAG TPA: hypothetical protein VIO36_13715 [Anaerolineaceae bacterium]
MKSSRKTLFLLTLVIGLCGYLALAYFFYGNFDQVSYEMVVKIMRAGGNVYAETHRYNYSPVWSFCLLGFDALARLSGLPLHFVIRAFLTLVNLANCLLLYQITNRSLAVWIVTWLNPVIIFTVGFHGQFEVLSLLPLLVAALLHRQGRLTDLGLLLLGTAAVVLKQNIAFAVWMAYFLLVRRPLKALVMLAISGTVFLATFLPYLPEGAMGILRNVLLYSSVPRAYGLRLFPAPDGALLFMALMMLTPLVAKIRNKDLLTGLFFSYLVFLTFMPGFSMQHFLPLFFFGSVKLSRFLAVFTALFVAYILASVDGFALPMREIPLNVLWAVLVAWLGWFAAINFRQTARQATPSAQLPE